MREIVFDTETTGLEPSQGHRVIEIGCIELINRFPSGKTFHRYINPERDVPPEAFAVHGLSGEFLKDKPLFGAIIDELIGFLGDAPLVAHNALFDLGFLNAELDRAGKPPVARERLVDTLMLARRKHPAGPNRLDDLCTRYGIDNSRRTKHGALLDAEILAEVYVELIGGRQASLVLLESGRASADARHAIATAQVRPQPLAPQVSEGELQAHATFVDSLGNKAIWLDYRPAVPGNAG
jgi:DNA polymerase III subunit epsilon